MKIKGNHILIAAMAVIILLMLYCSPNGTDPSKGGTIVTHKTVIDTTYVPGIPDTIPFYDTIPRYVEVPIAVPYYDTIKELNIYENPYEDSLLSGIIHSEVDGMLVVQSFTYTPKFPKYITKTDTLKIHRIDSVTINHYEKKKLKFYAGFEFGGNTQSFSASPVISLVDKKMNHFSYRYDVIGKTHNIGYSRQLKFK